MSSSVVQLVSQAAEVTCSEEFAKLGFLQETACRMGRGCRSQVGRGGRVEMRICTKEEKELEHIKEKTEAHVPEPQLHFLDWSAAHLYGCIGRKAGNAG